MKTYETELTTGVTRTPEFERKHLASFAVNCGLKCGHEGGSGSRIGGATRDSVEKRGP